MARLDPAKLFRELYSAPTEAVVDEVLSRHPAFADPANWRPYGQNESNFGVVENQQASPIPALIEKVINAIDAILMRRCYEEGIDPRSDEAPRSVEDAVLRFFPRAGDWDLPTFRKSQAESIQVLADGPRFETSLIVYDNGEGQHPKDFERTFLSLLRGNKTEIHFVQGKYNMGGSGAVAFCGRKRYQLVGSRRFDRSGPFGFTLVRRHPLSAEERVIRRATWYEYFVFDGQIPSFDAPDAMDLGLHNRQFTTGSVLKLYSYDLPAGSRSVISRDLNQSINEYLFSPALPILTVDTAERYPKDRNLQRDLYGLKRRLEEEGNKYVDEFFSEEYADETMGRIKVTCYAFSPKLSDRTAKETKETIQREFFKNGMSVLFSVHGQVHGHYTAEFITRALKYPLLRDYLLIQVDCDDLRLEFRNELFMASRDRLKEGEESRQLRHKLTEVLTKGRLADLHARRKASISVEGSDTDQLIRNFTRNLPLKSDLVRLISQTFKIDERSNADLKTQKRAGGSARPREVPNFLPQRFPSFFKIDRKADGTGMPVVQVPLGGERTIRFSTDVEDQYFDRINEPGELKLALLTPASTSQTGGGKTAEPRELDALLSVSKSSPNRGTIRVTVAPAGHHAVGDNIKLRADLTAPGQPFEQIFFVKITDPEKPTIKEGEDKSEPAPQLGLPKLLLAYKEPGKGDVTWDMIEQQGIQMDYQTVMHPLVEGDLLTAIYINMDCHVLLSFKAGRSTEETLRIADKRFMSAVYFHTLFLYMITRNRQYSIVRPGENGRDHAVDLTEYLKDLFQTYYSEFLLKFEVQDLIANLES